jgi:hypothetical protein
MLSLLELLGKWRTGPAVAEIVPNRADGTAEGVPALLRGPTLPSGARVHRAGVPAPAHG